MTDHDTRVMHRHLPFPFPGKRFPNNLGAVVMLTVLDGHLPALYVIHTPDNEWAVSDGINDPNVEGASMATHLRHVVDRDPTLEELATLPCGFEANRDEAGEKWRITPFNWHAEGQVRWER